MRFLFIISVAAFLFGCSQPKVENEVKDLIPTVNLMAGVEKEIIVSDLFYARDYNLSFLPSENISATYFQQSNKLTLTADADFAGYTLAKFKLNDKILAIPIRVINNPKSKFSFKPNKKYNFVSVFGEFNSWDRKSLPMQDDDGDGIYETELLITPGTYQYKFYGDGDEIVDSNNPKKIDNGMGSFNSILEVADPNADAPYLFLDSKNSNEAVMTISFELNKIATGINPKVIALFNNEEIPAEQVNVTDNTIEVSVKIKSFGKKDEIRVAVNAGNNYSNVQHLVFVDGKPAGETTASQTWYDAVIYSLMTDRFNNGDATNDYPVINDSVNIKANYRGGDLQGIIDKLEEGYFNDLGINTLWVSPLYPNPDEAYKEYPAPHRWFTGYHGYWPIDPRGVQKRFGDMALVKKFVNVAHQHNIKVLLDFVSNHVHELHPYYKNHPEWFGSLELPDGRLNLRHWDEFRLTTWFEPYMPSFDYIGSKEAIKQMTDDAVWWLKETGADGFRHDAVKHVPNEFWRELTRKLKDELAIPNNVEIYQIGETFGDYDLVSSYVNNGQLSAQFNFNLYNIAQEVFIKPDASFEMLRKELEKTASVYGTLQVMGNIMDSHDKNRYMAYADGDLDLSQWSAIEEGWNNPPKVDHKSSYSKATLYLAYMNTISGVPVIYYGSEFGMTGASDPDNRRLMRFGDDIDENEKAMLHNVQNLIKLRNEHSALRYGDMYVLEADQDIFAYIRSDLNERVLVILNKDEANKNVELKLPAEYGVEKAVDLLNPDNELNTENSKLKTEMDGISYKLIELL